jgi:hypothetical protein
VGFADDNRHESHIYVAFFRKIQDHIIRDKLAYESRLIHPNSNACSSAASQIKRMALSKRRGVLKLPSGKMIMFAAIFTPTHPRFLQL